MASKKVISFMLQSLAIVLLILQTASLPMKRSAIDSGIVASLVNQEVPDEMTDKDSSNPASAIAWRVEDYPNPRISPEKCGRENPSFICDPDGVLEPVEADSLESKIRAIQNETSCLCDEETCTRNGGKGVTIGIAIMKNMYTPYPDPLSHIPYTTRILRNSWNLGSCEDDILILLVENINQLYTDVGKRLSEILPPLATIEVFSKNKRYFESNNYLQGLHDMLSEYADKIVIGMPGHYMSIQKIQEEDEGKDDDTALAGTIGGIIVGIAIVIGIAIFVGIVVRRRMTGEHERFHLRSNKGGRKKDAFKPISISPMTSWNMPGGVYEPCSTEDNGTTMQEQKSTEYNIEPAHSAEELNAEGSDEDNANENIQRERGLSAVKEESEEENRQSVSSEEPAESRSRAKSVNENDVEVIDPKSERNVDEKETTPRV